MNFSVKTKTTLMRSYSRHWNSINKQLDPFFTTERLRNNGGYCSGVPLQSKTFMYIWEWSAGWIKNMLSGRLSRPNKWCVLTFCSLYSKQHLPLVLYAMIEASWHSLNIPIFVIVNDSVSLLTDDLNELVMACGGSVVPITSFCQSTQDGAILVQSTSIDDMPELKCTQTDKWRNRMLRTFSQCLVTIYLAIRCLLKLTAIL